MRPAARANHKKNRAPVYRERGFAVWKSHVQIRVEREACAQIQNRARTVGTAASPSSIRRQMSAPISRISPSPMPRVVTAGVPSRTPLVTRTDCVSNGMVFLLAVMFAASSRSCICAPVRPRL